MAILVIFAQSRREVVCVDCIILHLYGCLWFSVNFSALILEHSLFCFVFFLLFFPCRYNFFIVLYPLGVIGELLSIYAALPFVRRSGMYSMRLPNKYNVSFDYYYCLIIVMLSYIPRKETVCLEPTFFELLQTNFSCKTHLTHSKGSKLAVRIRSINTKVIGTISSISENYGPSMKCYVLYFFGRVCDSFV